MDRKSLRDLMERANEVTRAESQLLLNRYGSNLPEAVKNNDVVHFVDRGFARMYLANTPLKELPNELLAISIFVKIVHHSEIPILFAMAIWSFFLFGWWGVLSAPTGAVFFFKGHQSNVFGRGFWSIIFAFGFLAFAYYSESPAEIWWSVLGSATAIAQKLAYLVAIPSVRSCSLRRIDLCHQLVAKDVVWLRQPGNK